MINTGLNFASFLGLAEFLLANGYFFISIVQVIKVIRNRSDSLINKILRILQAIFAPLIILISGFILIFQGWRLDTLFIFQQILFFILLNYLIWRDWQAYKHIYQL